MVKIAHSLRCLDLKAKIYFFYRLKLADSTRKIAILKSNETMMIRRYRAVEENEAGLR